MLNPQHILITGASGGLGAALALAYAAPHVRLSLHGRNARRLGQTATEVRKRGATVTVEVGDVTDVESMARWIAACDAMQPLDLVIANAGLSLGTADGQESAAQTRAIVDVNLMGVLNTVHPAAALMRERGQGQIALISSLAGFWGSPGAPAYCASKAAVRIYGEALRGDLAPLGVAVNVVCPGFIKTPMTDANPFPMPLIMSADKAAGIIRKGLAANRPRIAFPWTLYALVRLLAALPQDWTERLLPPLPKKGGEPLA